MKKLMRQTLSGFNSLFELSNLSQFRESVRKAFSSLFVNMFGLFINFFVTLLLAKILSTAEFGVFTYIYTWLGILLIFSVLGFDSLLVRSIPKYTVENKNGHIRGLLRYTNKVALTSGVLISVVVCLVVSLVDLHEQHYMYAVLVALITLPMMSLGLMKQAALRGIHKVIQARVPDIIVRPLIIGSLVLITYMLGYDIDSSHVMVFNLTGVIVALLLSSIFLAKYARDICSDNFQYEKQQWHAIAFPLLLIAGMFSLLNYIDTIMIGIMATVDDVAIYALAAKFAILVLFILQAFNVVLAPKISEYFASGDNEKLQAYVKSMSRIMFLATLPIILILVLFGDYILRYFGDVYQQGYAVMVILAVGQIVNVSFGPVGFLLSMTQYQKLSFRILLISLLVNIVLNIPAIYFFNILGAAGATAISIILRNYLMWRSAKRYLNINSFAL